MRVRFWVRTYFFLSHGLDPFKYECFYPAYTLNLQVLLSEADLLPHHCR
jgi:hypothetical protein